MNYRVVHFEIHADQPDRAIAFYSGLFGWAFDKWNGPIPNVGWLAYAKDTEGNIFGMMQNDPGAK
jgi:predicted enzyme related to lactoylglutathione lyase